MVTKRAVKIGFPVQFPRSISPQAVIEFAKAVEASGVVDDLLTFDYLVSLIPRAMWTPDVTPAANLAPDNDSYHDAFILAAMASTASNLGICILTDAMRRGPWLVQTMLSLAGATKGQVSLALGAGEARHGAPFGYARNEGLGRLKELLKIWKLFIGAKAPVDFEGKYWKLRQSYLGSIQPAKPRILALGGGPKLVDAAARDADGLLTYAPGAWSSAEDCAKNVAGIRETVKSYGRDPDTFEIGLTIGVLISDNPEEIQLAMANKQVRFYCAIFGRLIMSEWDKEGLEPPFPRDWHYAEDLFPLSMTRAECEEAVRHVTPEMVRKSLVVGSPKEVAAELQKYVDAGITWISPFDIGGFVQQDPTKTVARLLEVCGILKGKAPAAL